MQKVSLREYSTKGYDSGPRWRRTVWLLISRVFFESFFPWPSSFKSSILRLYGANIGSRVVIKPQVKFKYPWHLDIGDDCWIGEQVWIDNVAHVSLSDNVVLSQGAYLLTGNHDYNSRTFDLTAAPISIESGAWIAAMAIVGPGTLVKRLAVVCAGSVATGELSECGVYRGNPASQIHIRKILD